MVVRTISALLLLATVTLLTPGCGYYNPYLVKGRQPISLHRSMWSNRTTEIGLVNAMFQAQSDWFRKSPLISLTDSAERADYKLTGSIDRVTYPEVSFGRYQEGTEGRAELTVSFALEEKKSGQVVWQRKGVSRQETFYMSQDPMQLQANRNAALQEIADDFAEEIYLYLINIMMRPDLAPVSK